MSSSKDSETKPEYTKPSKLIWLVLALGCVFVVLAVASFLFVEQEDDDQPYDDRIAALEAEGEDTSSSLFFFLLPSSHSSHFGKLLCVGF